jgi:hypothetical protein
VVDEGGHVAAGAVDAVDPVEQRGEGCPVGVGGYGGVLLLFKKRGPAGGGLSSAGTSCVAAAVGRTQLRAAVRRVP